MHAMKIVVGAAAALLVGATSAQTVHDSSFSSASSPPWTTGEAWGDQATAPLSRDGESLGAQGRSYDQDSTGNTNSSTSGRSSKPMITGEAYDGQHLGGSADGSYGAHGRSFEGSGMSEGDPMGDTGQRGSASPSSDRMSQYIGG